MKTSYLLLVFVMVLLCTASCIKQNVCACYEPSGTTEPTRFRFNRETRKKAAEKCEAIELTVPGDSVDCRLE
jgi:hypothetical protein